MDLAAFGKPRLAHSRSHVAVNAMYVGFQFQDAALFAIIIPAIVLQLDPRGHVGTFAGLATLSLAIQTGVPMVAGWVSDRAKGSGYSRRAQTAIVLLLDLAALTVIGTTHSISILRYAIALAALALASATTVYQAILPEVVPRAQWGVSTGVRGAFTLLGATVGLISASTLQPSLAVFVNAAILGASALSLMTIPHRPERRIDAGTGAPSDRRDLIVTMIMRGCMVLGMGLFSTYILYYFTDVRHVAQASLRTGIFGIIALGGAVFSSIISGLVSDRVDRRYIVFASGLAMAAAGLGFAFAPFPRVLFAYAALFGVGLGAAFAVGVALALDAVPVGGAFGRDLGIWSTLSGAPAIAAPGIGAAIFARFGNGGGGYQILFIVASLSFTAGAVAALAVRKTRARGAAG